MRLVLPRPQRRRREGIVPMINVVFLLLVFFLMTAEMGVAPPFGLALPVSEASRSAEGRTALFVAADGRLSYGGESGEAALAALARGAAAPLEIRADAALPARELARLLGRLAGVGVTSARLVSRPR